VADGVHTSDAIEPLAAEWDELADRAGASPFLRPGWAGPWWRAFGKGSLEILVLRRRGRLAGVLPLYRRRGVVAGTANSWSEAYEPLGEDADAVAELGAAAFRARPRRAVFLFLSSDRPGLGLLRAAAGAAGYRMVERILQRSPYVPIDGDWTTYEAGLDGKLRREVGRRVRRLEGEGELSFEVTGGGDRLGQLLDDGFRLEAAAWKGAAGTAITARPEVRSFYEEVAAWACDRGILRLAFLRLGGEVLAFDYCLEDQGVHYLLKTGYDPDRRRFAPGIIIRHRMIERAFLAGLGSYEFLGRDEPWKLAWTGARREQVALRAYAPTPAGALDWLQAAHARRLAKRLLRPR
jgi:CelD/BcsL family acetyltransferase involved in cellulose biosynthesis